MKNIFNVVILILSFTASVFSQDKFIINGKLTGAPDGSKILLRFIQNGIPTVQTVHTTVVSGGTFEITGTIDEPTLAWIEILPSKPGRAVDHYNLFFIEKGRTTINGIIIDKSKITGGPVQREWLKSGLGPLRILRDSAMAILADYLVLANPDTAKINRIRPIYEVRQKKYEEAENAFFKSDQDSYVTLSLLQARSRKTKKVDPSDPIFESVSPRLRSTVKWRELQTFLDNARDIKVSIGNKAPDFIQPDTSGKVVSLSSLRGKYVLIEFWASWCKPCRAENTGLVKIYKDFKLKNFEIISVSLDDDKIMWKNAIKQDKLLWLQVSDLQRMGYNVAANAYHVNSVPSNFLIDPNGVIVARHLRGENLAMKLREILK